MQLRQRKGSLIVVINYVLMVLILGVVLVQMP
jgi:hypothetical protein